MFRRQEQCASDFAWLASQAERAVAAGALDPRYAAAALYHHGVFQERQGNQIQAIDAWTIAARIAPSSHGGTEAAKRLKTR
jgi:hypothetical protein